MAQGIFRLFRLLLLLLGGYCLAEWLPEPFLAHFRSSFALFWVPLPLLLPLVAAYVPPDRWHWRMPLRQVGITCTFFFLGLFFSAQAQSEPEDEPLEGLFILEIRSSPLDRGYRQEYRARTLRVKTSADVPWQKSVQELLFYGKDSLLQAGDRLLVRGVRRPFREAENPHAFDYKRFQLYNGLEGGLYPEAVWQLPEKGFFPLERLAAALEEALQRYLAEDVYVQQVARALLLGEKRTMDRELSAAYAAAGAMHVLAVSGLHVGLVYGFFFFLLPPERVPKRWRFLYVVAVVALIWLYAGLTGGSASVQRAALMFSLMALSKVGRRPQKGVHAVFLSALLLLAWQPSLLFSLGFQLSYAAVLGILYVQPLLTRLWPAPPALLRPVWELTCVSVAAQIGTYPLTAAYFHVFPTYFLLTNLIVIPGAFVIMGLGLPFLLFSWWEGLAKLLAFLLQQVIQLFNYLVFHIESLPNAQLEGLFFSPLQQVLYVLALVFLLQAAGKFRKRSLVAVVMVAFLWPLGQCLDLLLRSREVKAGGQEQRWQVREGEAWGYWQQGRFWLFANALPAEEQRFAVYPWLVRQAFPVARGQLLEREGQLFGLLPSGQLEPLPVQEEAAEAKVLITAAQGEEAAVLSSFSQEED